MKKIITALLCLSIFTLLLAGCTPNEPEEPSDEPCSHSYSDGKCIHCDAADPNYKPSDNNGGGESEDVPGEDDQNPEIPNIDLDGEAELPFVPAK